MGQQQPQRHELAAYIESIRQTIRAIAQTTHDDVVQRSWALQHTFRELASLEHGLGRLRDVVADDHVNSSSADPGPGSSNEPGAGGSNRPGDGDSNMAGDGDSRRAGAHLPILQSCEAVVGLVATGGLVAAKDASIRLSWLNSALSFCMDASASPSAVLLRLSLMGADPPTEFHDKAQNINMLRDAGPGIPLLKTTDVESVTAEVVSTWLVPFERLKTYEPSEYYHERFKGDLVDRAFGGISDAALDWPLYAEPFWPALEADIMSIFVPDRNYGFVNWLLHFSRAMWPDVFGWHAPSNYPFITLTDALCSGQIKPLHIAAAFGLSSLCDRLLSLGANANEPGTIGTPLWCALVGPEILVNCVAGRTWAPLSNRYLVVPSRPDAVGTLLDAGASCDHALEDAAGEPASMSGVAFWASFKTQDDSLLQRIVRARPVFDSALISVVENLDAASLEPNLGGLVSRLLTVLFDECLRIGSISESTAMGCVISSTLSRLDLKLNPPTRDAKLPVDEETLSRMAVTSIVTDDLLALTRCLLDPRFDPNPPTADPNRDETLLHLAVSGDFLEAIDILVEAGARLDAKDESGRVPLMVAESVSMMERLVLTHHADTTATDPDGRTIWHMMAATNDATLLEWLCVHDPSRDINMNKKTLNGRTPFVEALLSIHELATVPFRSAGSGSEPSAAHVLLKHCKHQLVFSSYGKPLAHLAVPWGDLGLIQGLHERGVDFCELDEDGRSPLHHVTLSASEEFVNQLIQWFPDAPWTCYAGFAAAEAIFQNTRLLESALPKELRRSMHPSCKRALSIKVYDRLLEPEALPGYTSGSEGFWPRFCNNVLKGRSADARERVLQRSMQTALCLVIKRGILADFEEKTGKPALVCLEGFSLTEVSRDGPYIVDGVDDHGMTVLGIFWDVKFSHGIISQVVRHSSAAMKRAFWGMRECHSLLVECCKHQGGWPIIRDLCAHGGELLLDDRSDFSGISVVQAAVAHFDRGCKEPLKSLIAKTTAEQLNCHRMAILDAIMKTHVQKRDGRYLFHFLVDQGLRVNPKREDEESMLAEIIDGGLLGLAKLIMGHGARVALGRNGYNALIAAARSNDIEVLAFVGREARKLGKGGFNWGSLHTPPGQAPRNALHEAAAHSDAEFMRQGLIDFPELREHINFVTDEGAPVHVAAQRGDHRLVAVLAEHGADLALRDSNPEQGYTALHHACRQTSRQLLATCIELGPQAVHVADHHGKTPMMLANELGNDLAVSLLRDSGLLPSPS